MLVETDTFFGVALLLLAFKLQALMKFQQKYSTFTSLGIFRTKYCVINSSHFMSMSYMFSISLVSYVYVDADETTVLTVFVSLFVSVTMMLVTLR